MPHKPAAVCVAVLLAFTAVSLVKAEPLQWQVATPFPDSSKPQKALVKAAKHFARSSDDGSGLRFVGREIGSPASMLEFMQQSDACNAALIPAFELSSLIPDAVLYDQFFLFTDFPEANTVRQSMDQVLLQQAQHADYAVLGIAGLGFIHLMSDRKFASIQELSGQQVAIPGRLTAYAQFFNALNVTTQPPPHDAQPALMLNSTIALILDKRIPRLDHLVAPPVQYAYLLLVAKRADWEALSSKQRAALLQLFSTELREMEETAEKAATRAARVLRKGGMQVLPLQAVELASLRASGKNQQIAASLQEQLSLELAKLRK